MIHRLPLVALTALVLCTPTAFAQPQMNATPLPADQKITIDGRLDEPIWQQAPAGGPFLRLKVSEKNTPPAATTFKVLRDSDSIYFAVTCDEPLMDKLSDAPMDRDGPVYQRDCVEIFLAPNDKPADYYQFMISAGNTIADFYFIEGGNTTGGEYNVPIQSAVHKGKNFWSVEVRIPLMVFFRTLAADFSDTWLVNVTRERQTESELTTWSPLRAGFHESTKFQRIGDMPRKDARFDLCVTDLRPALTSAQGDHWIGDIQLPVIAAGATAGEYRLTVTSAGHTLTADHAVRIAPGSSAIAVKNVPFASLGKAVYDIRLTDAAGRAIVDTSYTVRTEYAPMTVTLDEPFYGNAIFPGQQVDRIRGSVTLNLPKDVLDASMLHIALAGNDAPLTIKPTDGAAKFSLDVKNLADGEYPLTFTVRRGEQIVADHALVIRKLAPPAGSCVYIDEHRRLMVDGKPIHVRGWYGNHTYMVSQALLDQYGDQPDSKFVNTWSCQIGMEAERIDPAEHSADHVRKDMEPSARIFAVMKERIEKARDSKTLWWYYLSDEPECRGVSPVYLKHQYDFIKKLDPYHPVMIITRDPARYTGCADILNPHPYLSPTVNARGVRFMRSPKEIRDQMRTVLSAGKGKIPAWFCGQAFSYNFADPQADYPNFTEYRCMMWTAAANGATGYTPFMYCDHYASPDLRIGCDFVYESMAALDEFLNSAESPLQTAVDAPGDGVDVRAIKVNGKVLLIAVNLLDQPVSANIQITGMDDIAELHGFRENTAAKLAKGELTLSFTPYQVHLLTSVKLGEQLRSVADVRREIADARAALKKPGNLLFGRGNEIECDSSDTYMSGRAVTASLTDGYRDAYGWAAWSKRQLPAWVELQFPNFIPAFKTVKVYTATVEDAELQIWKAGDWITVGKVEGNHDPVITFQLAQPMKTVKLKLLMTRVRTGTKAEIYEIEMYE
ncbi:MAG: sugar-binding protein [Phycisphaerales bacterium]